MKTRIIALSRWTAPSRVGILGLLAMLSSISAARADGTNTPAPPPPPPPPPKKWDSTVTAGVTLTRGNSDNLLATIAAGTKRSWATDEALFGATAGYGETTTTVNGTKTTSTTDSYVRGFGQWNHLFTRQFYAGIRLAGEHDDVANLAYRLSASPLIGYYFVKTTNTFLSGEIGPAFVTEKFFDTNVNNYVALRLGERGEHKFANGAKIWESVNWTPQVKDFNNYYVYAEAGASAPLSKAFSLSLVLQDSYRSVPAQGKLKNDLKLIAGLTYNF